MIISLAEKKKTFQATMTFYQNLDSPHNFGQRNEFMLNVLINIDLKSHAFLFKNPIKTLRERTIRNFILATSVFPPYFDYFWALD